MVGLEDLCMLVTWVWFASVSSLDGLVCWSEIWFGLVWFGCIEEALFGGMHLHVDCVVELALWTLLCMCVCSCYGMVICTCVVWFSLFVQFLVEPLR